MLPGVRKAVQQGMITQAMYLRGLLRKIGMKVGPTSRGAVPHLSSRTGERRRDAPGDDRTGGPCNSGAPTGTGWPATAGSACSNVPDPGSGWRHTQISLASRISRVV